MSLIQAVRTEQFELDPVLESDEPVGDLTAHRLVLGDLGLGGSPQSVLSHQPRVPLTQKANTQALVEAILGRELAILGREVDRRPDTARQVLLTVCQAPFQPLFELRDHPLVVPIRGR
jgi:hypothetical protein